MVGETVAPFESTNAISVFRAASFNGSRSVALFSDSLARGSVEFCSSTAAGVFISHYLYCISVVNPVNESIDVRSSCTSSIM